METLITVQNEYGDVATYVVQDDKHSMFIFNAKHNTTELSTITKVGEGYAFLYFSEGSTMNEVWPEGLGEHIINNWSDVLYHLNVACDR